jgi:7-cyano-7-deazaguanine synthase
MTTNNTELQKRAVILLSGGMDSATVLAIAKQQGYQCYALSFRYGQRHSVELKAASRIAKQFKVERHETIDLNLSQFGGSALTDDTLAIPKQESGEEKNSANSPVSPIPVTYVPARNTVFLSIALGWAEVLEAQAIFIGVNAVDYSGYPDCRPEFIKSFEQTANLATKAGVEANAFHIHTPLIDMSKGDIITQGIKLGIDYSQTITCYDADSKGQACGQCEACRLRKKGFEEAGITDNTIYQKNS